MDKQAYRKAILKDISSLEWETISYQICHKLAFYLQDSYDKVIAGYCAHGYEPDIFLFFDFWQEEGGVCCLPVITKSNHPLTFRQWDVHKPLIKGKYDILVPDETTPEIIPDILLTPLVAFDKQGNRLGRGGGYYDRTISYLRQIKPDCQIIGIGCEQQYIKTLPTENHDAKLDIIITEAKFVLPIKIR